MASIPHNYQPLPDDPVKKFLVASKPRKYLPEDIVMEILYRLPVESLVRCRSVCKAWHQIISSTFFMTTHLAYQKASSKKCILYYEAYCSYLSLISDFESILDGSFMKIYAIPPLFEEYDLISGPKIYGIANGLLLLCLSKFKYRGGDDIYLYNLGCRKLKKLPQLGIITKADIDHYDVPSVSFGYYDDDYKVIVIAPVGNTYINVYVYSLGKNSWENIYTNFDAGISNFFFDGTKFVVDTVYAVTSTQVICFDLRDKAIRLVKFPIELCCQHKTIEAYGETVVVFAYDSDHNLSMWILRDKFSWVKKFSFELQKGCHEAEAIGILDNGKYLVWTCNEKGYFYTFFLCDLDLLTLTEIRPMSADLNDHFHSRIHSNYVESLLLLNEVNPDPMSFFVGKGIKSVGIGRISSYLFLYFFFVAILLLIYYFFY